MAAALDTPQAVRRAAMDLLARREHGRVELTRKLQRKGADPSLIDAELDRKLSEPLRRGGTVFALDHRIPNGTPLENYRYYVRSARERLGLPPAVPAPHVRMAF